LVRLIPSDTRRFWRGLLPLLLALTLSNGSNYIFHVVISRLLGPSRYGALAALLAVILILSVPFGVLQTIVAKRTALLRTEGTEDETGNLAVGATRSLTLLGAGAAVILIMVSPILSGFLHTGVVPAALIGPYAGLALLTSVPLGVLQGELRFHHLATAAVVGVMTRLAFGIGFVWAGLGVSGAILASVLAQAVSLAVAVGLLRLPKGAWRAAGRALSLPRGDFGIAFLSLGAFWLLAEADLVLARHYLPATAAGRYSAAGLVARAVLFFPAAISMVALPRFAETQGRGSEARRWLRLSLVATGVLLAVALLAVILLRGQVVAIAFGDRFLPAEALVPALSAAMGLLAIANLLVYFHVAAATRTYRITFAAVVIETVLIVIFHHSPQQIALVVMGVSAAVGAVQYRAAVSVYRWRPPLSALNGEGNGASVEDPLVQSPTLDVTVVLPCHNAGAGLRQVLTTLHRELKDAGPHEIIVVSDGSTDETVAIGEEFVAESVRVLDQPSHDGKGSALRAGLLQARGKYVAFMDADGDIDPEGIVPFLEIMRLYQPDIVLGSKRHPLSEVTYPPLRRVLSWVYHRLTKLLFRVSVRDTQTGLKLIRRDVLAAVLPRMLEKRYAFDLELLVVARRLGFTGVFEAPVRIDYRFDSRVDPRAAFRILLDTIAVFYRRYVLDTYRSEGEEGVAHRWRRPDLDGQLRILFLNWRDIRNPDAGGAEVVTHEVGKRWVAQGHEVALLTSRFPGCLPTETVDGVRIRRIGRLRTGSFHLRVQWKLAHLRGYDLVIDEINTIPFFTPLWRRRLPPTVTLIHQLARDVLEAELPPPVAAVGRRLEPRMLRLYADAPVVTVSESTRQDLLAIGLRDVSVVPDGRDESPELDGIEKEAVPTFLFVGRLAPNKRPDHAVAAFQSIRDRMPDAQLWIVGRGPMEKELRRKLPDGAEMLGFLSRDELYRRMARAHCLLVPSVREGWGLVVIEAASVGTPAVGYDVSGIRDSVRDGATGLLATDGVSRALADRAVSLVKDGLAYEAIRREAMAWASEFSWELTADRLIQVAGVAIGRASDSPRGAIAEIIQAR
jgi:glycosyltransferase involved in cell wall biosynthesis/O-antigen/teichoic acid export membrane protein